MAIINIGVDVGQRVDPTAIAVVELLDPVADTWYVRYLKRLPLGTSYPDVAARIAALVKSLQAPRQELQGYRYVELPPHDLNLYVDATGVGQPVVDMLAVEGLQPWATYFTWGDRRNVDGREIRLGKAWLVSRLQALMQSRRLNALDTEEAEALIKELEVYEIRVDENANDRYGAFKTGAHDDLVTAVGLAVQEKPVGLETMSPQMVSVFDSRFPYPPGRH